MEAPSVVWAAGIIDHPSDEEPHSDRGTKQNASENFGSVGLSDSSINENGRNTLDALLNRKCSLHSTVLNARMLEQLP